MDKRVTLKDIDEMLKEWSRTLDVYQRRREEGMDHESGFDLSETLFDHLADAERVVRNLVAIIQKVRAEKMAYNVGAPEIHELRYEANTALAEVE